MATQRTKTLKDKTISGLRAIIAAVLADPKNYNQNQFHGSGAGCLAFFHSKLTAKPETHAKRCKVIDSGNYDGDGPMYNAAMKELGITDTQASALFCTGFCWPGKFSRLYNSAKGPKSRARAAEKLIEAFIKVNGDVDALREL